MRRDLDRLMAERQIDAFIIPGTEGRNTAREYLTRSSHVSAMVIKKQGHDPIVIANHMEADEAAKSGFRVMTNDDFDYEAIMRQYGRGSAEAQAAFLAKVFETLGISGRVTFYGNVDMQYAIRLLRMVEEHLPQVEIVTDDMRDIFKIAYQTKDPDELEKLADVGKRTGAAMQATRAWLSTHRALDGQIVDEASKPLTIGDVKRYLRFQLLERDLEEEATIFAQGRDAGIPHNRGEADDILHVGESIVFDLFPRCINTGYYHDMTRTWSLGYARDDVQRDFDTVKDVFFRSLEEITKGQPTNIVATMVCDWFESAGHPSRKSTPNTTEGYVHALGHGIGLEVHEPPLVSHNTDDKMIFEAGNVVTIEPGLYYPSKGYGIRIEDTVYLDENGHLHNFTDCPYDLIVPLAN